VSSDGGSFGSLGLHVGSRSWTACWEYPDHTPILNITAASTSVSVQLAQGPVGSEAVKFARDLLRGAERFAAEVERLHTEQQRAEGEAA
jgi:hypothetical protein